MTNRFITYLFTLLLATMAYGLSAQDVVFNEIMQSNVDALMVKQDFPDSWIELYNNRSASLGLKGWRIGLTDDYSKAWAFRNSMTIGGHSHLLVYCDKVDNGYQHTDFHLDAKRCTLYLWDAEGNLVDSLVHPKQPAPNIAYGRTKDGQGEWQYEVTPTPGAQNSGVFTDLMLPDPVFSLEGCVMPAGSAGADVVEISFPDEKTLADGETLPADARLCVTTDGSAPTRQSPGCGRGEVYRIKLDHTTVVRARFVSDEALMALPVTHSYIRHPRQLALPVFAFNTDGRYLYDEEIGMLLGTDYTGNCYKGWRRPFNLEYFEPTSFHQAQINQVCEAGMHGAGSLSHKQKAMNVYTNKRWQKKRFDSHTFWPGKPELQKTKTFCVRNGGSRCLDSRMEDAFVQRLFAQHIDSLQYLEYRACIVYINGEYRGLYGLRERANHTWAENNRGVAEDVAVEIEGFYTDDEAFAPVKALIDSDQATYADYCRYLDMPLLLDYLCCQAFATNVLFPHSNVNMWMDPTGDDRRIHPLLKDLDALAETPASANWYNFITLTGEEGTWGSSSDDRKIFVRLFALDEFRNAFIDRMQTYLGDFCKPSVTVPMVVAMRDEIDSEVAATFAAIDEGATYADFSRRIDELLIPYCQQRPMIHYQHLSDRFGLGRVVPMSVANPVREIPGLCLRVNGIALTEGNFEGACFAQRDVRLESGNLDYSWTVTTTFVDGTVKSQDIDSSTFSYRPDAAEADRIARVDFNVRYRPIGSHDVVLAFGKEGVTCSNPYDGNGVEVKIEDNHVSITSNSREVVNYVLQGEASEASVVLNSESPWRLTLDGVYLTSSRGTIIDSQTRAAGIVALASDKENVLENQAQEADRQSPGAAIHSIGALTFEGEGHLAITTTGKVGNCIVSESDLTLCSGTYNLTNRSKGLKEYGAIYSGNILHSEADVRIHDGHYTLLSTGSSGRGVTAQGQLVLGVEGKNDARPVMEVTMTGSTMYTPSDNGTLTAGSSAFEAQGAVSIYGATELNASATDNASNGIKSHTSISIYGGRHNFHCYDDCLNSPGPISFEGGTTVCFSTNDDAIDSDYPYPGAIRLSGGNLFTYTLDVATEEGLDCDGTQKIFVSGGIVVSAGGAHDPNERQVGGSTQGYYLGPGITDCDASNYYSLIDTAGRVVCTYRFRESFANRMQLITAPELGNGTFRIVYGPEPPIGFDEAVGDSFWIGGSTTNSQSYTLQTVNAYPTTMAIMGASISVLPESHVCKDYWAEAVELEIRDYGIKGAGLCSTTQPGYGLQEEVDDVTFAGRPSYDAYLIWAPSNDFQKGGSIGTVGDYSIADGYDPSRLVTMCGGLNYILRSIRMQNPKACVLLFTTMPIFSRGAEGYDPEATGEQAMRRYVEAQIAWCEQNDVPYLDLFRLSGLTPGNCSTYMLDDKVHLNEHGYDLIRPQTTEFLLDHIVHRQTIVRPSDGAVVSGVFDMAGRRRTEVRHGFNIVRYADGRVAKIFIK